MWPSDKKVLDQIGLIILMGRNPESQHFLNLFWMNASCVPGGSFQGHFENIFAGAGAPAPGEASRHGLHHPGEAVAGESCSGAPHIREGDAPGGAGRVCGLRPGVPLHLFVLARHLLRTQVSSDLLTGSHSNCILRFSAHCFLVNPATPPAVTCLDVRNASFERISVLLVGCPVVHFSQASSSLAPFEDFCFIRQ